MVAPAYVLGHRDIPGISLVTAWWLPPAVAMGAGAGTADRQPLLHSWVELPGGVVFEAAVQEWFDQETFYSQNSVVIFNRYSPEHIEEILGAPSWHDATQQQQDYQRDLLRYHGLPAFRRYLWITGLERRYGLNPYYQAVMPPGVFGYDPYRAWLEIYRYRRVLGIDKQETPKIPWRYYGYTTNQRAIQRPRR